MIIDYFIKPNYNWKMPWITIALALVYNYVKYGDKIGFKIIQKASLHLFKAASICDRSPSLHYRRKLWRTKGHHLNFDASPPWLPTKDSKSFSLHQIFVKRRSLSLSLAGTQKLWRSACWQLRSKTVTLGEYKKDVSEREALSALASRAPHITDERESKSRNHPSWHNKLRRLHYCTLVEIPSFKYQRERRREWEIERHSVNAIILFVKLLNLASQKNDCSHWINNDNKMLYILDFVNLQNMLHIYCKKWRSWKEKAWTLATFS